MVIMGHRNGVPLVWEGAYCTVYKAEAATDVTWPCRRPGRVWGVDKGQERYRSL